MGALADFEFHGCRSRSESAASVKGDLLAAFDELQQTIPLAKRAELAALPHFVEAGFDVAKINKWVGNHKQESQRAAAGLSRAEVRAAKSEIASAPDGSSEQAEAQAKLPAARPGQGAGVGVTAANLEAAEARVFISDPTEVRA